jgi:hypothetical protein
MRVRWLRKALHNLNEEAAYIASDDAPRRGWSWGASSHQWLSSPTSLVLAVPGAWLERAN